MMKLAFSTLGCPGWTWNEIFAAAKDLGLDGIEIRGMGGEMFAPAIKCFLPANREETVRQMKAAKMTFPMLTSGACLGKPGASPAMEEQNLEEAKAYVDLAAEIGAPYVRVMITPVAAPEDADIARAGENYAKICDYAKGTGVKPLIETNGVFCDSKVLRAFMEKADPLTSGVLWDIHHPYRFHGESPRETYDNIGRWVEYIHVKDSVMVDNKVVYRMMGYGDVPVMDTLKILEDNGYDGYISLEWMKRWCPNLQEPGIVFSHFQSYMNCLMGQLR